LIVILLLLANYPDCSGPRDDMKYWRTGMME
jgi:hypothetical protein